MLSRPPVVGDTLVDGFTQNIVVAIDGDEVTLAYPGGRVRLVPFSLKGLIGSDAELLEDLPKASDPTLRKAHQLSYLYFYPCVGVRYHHTVDWKNLAEQLRELTKTFSGPVELTAKVGWTDVSNVFHEIKQLQVIDAEDLEKEDFLQTYIELQQCIGASSFDNEYTLAFDFNQTEVTWSPLAG